MEGGGSAPSLGGRRDLTSFSERAVPVCESSLEASSLETVPALSD